MPSHEGIRGAAAHLLAAWMSGRYYRTFRIVSDEPAASFDVLMQQRDRRVGVAVGVLWDDDPAPPGVATLEELLSADAAADESIVDGGYVVWVPPRVALPETEPHTSALRVHLAHALRGLEPGERREVRLPATVKLAKIQADGAYVSVSGGLSTVWLELSEGVPGAFHLDSRPIHRLPEQRAELDIIVSRIRDRAAVLEPEEYSDVQVHDYWVVSRLPVDAPHGVIVAAAPPDLDPQDGSAIRRRFRQEVQRAVAQKQAGSPDLAALVVVTAAAHLKDELVTAALRGMNPALYGALDLIAVIADGDMRQVLQPRSLPWEQPR
ncbi:MAG: hypothetical protein O2798_06945 [Chloroflexi bacterium]|nr:hypothetical protein [Chloroflexota bacterium]MDA1240563.1 hypothetical protein [Chloroflexota bacterium]MQC47846.1 hypothetical protein [Chloroflexota bacterium]